MSLAEDILHTFEQVRKFLGREVVIDGRTIKGIVGTTTRTLDLDEGVTKATVIGSVQVLSSEVERAPTLMDPIEVDGVEFIATDVRDRAGVVYAIEYQSAAR